MTIARFFLLQIALDAALVASITGLASAATLASGLAGVVVTGTKKLAYMPAQAVHAQVR